MNYTKISELPVSTNPSNVAVVPIADTGTTYQTTIDDFVGNSKSKNFSTFAILNNALAPSSGISSALAIGDNDIYTCPAGKRAMAFGGHLSNFSGGSVTAFVELKHSGTYYRITANATAANGAISNFTLGNSILDAGDSLAVNAVTTAGAYFICNLVEFSSSSFLSGAYVFGTTTGDNTLYTCPAGKTAILLSPQAGSGIQLRQPLTVGCGAVAPGNTQFSIIKSGGSPIIIVNAAVNISTVNSINQSILSSFTLSAGDSLIVNVAVGDPAQIVSCGIVEFAT